MGRPSRWRANQPGSVPESAEILALVERPPTLAPLVPYAQVARRQGVGATVGEAQTSLAPPDGRDPTRSARRHHA
jgi:hypothetical protein